MVSITGLYRWRSNNKFSAISWEKENIINKSEKQCQCTDDRSLGHFLSYVVFCSDFQIP
jgi:hypothetical protein